MKKLKLEELEVTSFATTSGTARERGTVNAHAKPGGPVFIETYNIERCGDTQYFDCTYGCSRESACPDRCILISDFDCTVGV